MNKESLLKTLPVNRMCLMFVFVAILIIYTQDSHGQSITASITEPLTEASLHESVVTLTLSGGRFVDSRWRIKDALSISGIEGVDFESWNVERVSDTVATVGLEFAGNIDINAVLTFTVEAGAIAEYNGNALVATLPVTAIQESLKASTEIPLTEAMLNQGIITLTLTGRQFVHRRWNIRDALSVSGIEGVSLADFLIRVSDTEVTIKLEFAGNIDEDATLTLAVGPDAIAGYDKPFTVQIPVTAVEESLHASTEAPLTEATLHGSIITLTLSGRQFNDARWVIGDALSVSGIDGVTTGEWSSGVRRRSDTEVTIELEFAGNIDEDATLTLTVGPDALVGYDKPFTFEFPVTAVEESLTASTGFPLTEATLDGSIISLSLSGRSFVEDFSPDWGREAPESVSGIEGVTVQYSGVRRVSDTEVTIILAFSGNIDADATLTLTVGTDAIVGYNEEFLIQLPVIAVEESLVAATAAPLTEATLDGSIISLSLNGRQFADWWTAEDWSVSGIDGVTFGYGERVSDTEIVVPLEFDGTDFDTDATLGFTVEANMANYNQALTAQIPVTAIQQSNATVSIAPSPVESPDLGERLIFNLNIAGGENIAGYQAIVLFDDTALSLVDAANGDYLPAEAFFIADGPIGESSQIIYSLSDVSNGNSIEDYRKVTLTANTLGGAGNGDGTLASLTFEVVDFKPSKVIPSQVYLVDVDGKRWEATTESAEVAMPPEPEELMFGDINRDDVVNIEDLAIVGARLGQRGKNSADVNEDGLVDIVDIVLVASAFDAAAAAPALYPQALDLFTTVEVSQWLTQAQGLYLTDATFQRGIRFLEQLLTMLTPKDTLLLPNYPNPFNPETWIPYRLAEDAFVTLAIYCGDGQVVRTFNVGYQRAAFYESQSKAIHWDGKNEFGEQVASGVYFYRLSAGDFSAIRKMLILK